MSWQKLPEDLKQLNSWCAARENRKPIDPLTGRAVGCDSALYSFEQITELAQTQHIGVWIQDTNLFCIDVDHLSRDQFKYMDEHTKQRWKKETRQLLTCPTYIEYSPSGQAFHVWGKGDLPNKQVGNFDIRSQRRFLVCTGNVYTDRPIVENKKLIEHLRELIKRENTLEEQITTWNEDEQVLQTMYSASNGPIIKSLMEDGDISNYESGSEADHALITYLHYHCKDEEQAFRLYQRSPLSQRPRIAKRNTKEYFKYTWNKKVKDQVILDQVAIELPQPEPKLVQSKKQIVYPDNLIGEIAEYVYGSAVRPLSDLSLLASLVCVAGVSGRNYNISSTGLNLYLTYLGHVGTGKESAQSGLSRLINAVSVRVPSVLQFVGPRKFASGTGLLRYLERRPSFFSILPEMSDFLSHMQARGEMNTAGLQQLINDLYNKSGAEDFVAPTVYAKPEDNIKLIRSPALSFLGESTPDTVMNLITSDLIDSGFLSRVLLFISDEERSKPNSNRREEVPSALVKKCSQFVEKNLLLLNQKKVCGVRLSPQGLRLLDDFNETVDATIRKTKEDSRRHTYTRGHLNALRVAALQAVAENPDRPTVSATNAQWAIDQISGCMSLIDKEHGQGTLGSAFLKTRQKVLNYCEQWSAMSVREKYKHRVPKAVAEATDPVVPLSYIKRRLMRVPYVTSHRMGQDRLIQSLMQSLIEDYYLTPLSKEARLKFRLRSEGFLFASEGKKGHEIQK